MRWHGRRPSVVTAVVMRHVLRRVKPAVRTREEQELQPCHGVDQRAYAGNPDLGLVVARAVFTFVVRLLLLLGVEGGGICAGRCGSRLLDLRLGLGLGAGRVAASAATPPTASTGAAAVWRNRCLGGGLAVTSTTSASPWWCRFGNRGASELPETPCPDCRRSRHTSVSGSAPTPRNGSVQGYG